MTKVDVIATRRAKFAKPGTRRTFTTSEARVLVLLGQATYVVSGSEVPRRGYLRRDMAAQPAAVAPAEPPHRPRARRVSSNTDISAATTAQPDGEA